MADRLQGMTALITGASRGLGAAIARTYWSQGANLILTARKHKNNNALQDLADELGWSASIGRRLSIVYADLSQASGVDRIMEEVVRADLHILVNNAAIQGPIGPLVNNDMMAWWDTLRVNLLAPVELCKRCVPLMEQGKRRRKIINISGGGAANPRPDFSAYATSKAGLVRFTETLAAEVSSLGIDVNAVAPGALGAMGQPKENSVAMDLAVALCLYLASSASDGISGKFISAIWDPWDSPDFNVVAMQSNDWYTLRRKI